MITGKASRWTAGVSRNWRQPAPGMMDPGGKEAYQMAGKYFDEFMVGEEFLTPTRTMTETDIVMFAAMTGDYNELHTS